MRQPDVKTNKPAKFHHVVEYRSTENWSTYGAYINPAVASDNADALAAQYPNMPVRVNHYLPA